MMPLKNLAGKWGSLLLLGGIAGCQLLGSLSVTNIGDIQKNYRNYSDVYVRGKVGAIAPLSSSNAYELQDRTGKIWVITSQSLPQPGEEMLVKGKVQFQSIPISGKEYGEVYVQEQQQLEKKPVANSGKR